MEVLAAEFPDIFTQYIEIVPEVVTEPVEVEVLPVAPSPVHIEDVRVVNVTSKTIQDIFLEHDYGQKAFVQEDPNQNFSKTDFQNTVFTIEERPKEMTIQSKENLYVSEPPYSVESRPCAQYDELDQILEDLRQCDLDQDSNSNILFQLEQEKSSLGCNWTSEYSSCDHGPVCPFTSKVLELSALPERSQSPAVGRNSVVVLRNTPAGYVQQHPVSLGLRSIAPPLAYTMNPVRYNLPTSTSSSSNISSSSRLNDITNQRLSSYRPPANTVLIKVPGPGLSLCSQCDSQFADNKSLVKHTRNQHQVYQCSKCGESTVGYYRMASHAKK